MKKLIAILFIMLTLLIGCESSSAATDDSIVVIGEKFFLTQVSDIYINKAEYLGKTIQYEGIFLVYEQPDEKIQMVIRYGPGCCGDDDMAGFEVIWEGDYPQPNDWVEVVGVLEKYDQHLRINASSLTVLPTRGDEVVFQ